MIEQKLNILLENSIIDLDTKVYVSNIFRYLLENSIVNDPNKLDSFLTHLAMADMRRKKDENIDGLDEYILSEILNHPLYDRSKELWGVLEDNFSNVFPDNEYNYFYLHIINLLEEE